MAMTSNRRTPREELLALQMRVFNQNKRLIRSDAVVEEPGFLAYERRYRRYVASYEERVEREEVLAAIDKAEVIYVGDYHTNPQAQRTLLRLLKLVTARIPNIGLALELVQDRYQAVLDRYLNNQISETSFLRRIQFKEYWYFDLWENFSPIFDFARFHRIPVYGVESADAHDKGLQARDRAMGERIAQLLADNPDQKLFVFVGDLHIAPPLLRETDS